MISLAKERNELEGLIRRFNYGVKGNPPDGMPKGKNAKSDPTGRDGAEAADLRRLWNKRLNEISALILEVEKEVMKLPSVQRRIVRLYYFEGIGDKRIARLVGYDVDVIGRKRRQAVRILTGEEDSA